MPDPGLSLTEYVVLALLCERPAHGWPIVRALAEDGEIGRIWTVRRGLVYRTIDQLTDRALVEASGTVSGGPGPARTILQATPPGHTAVRAWLGEPVEHVRDLRSELLLKLVLGARAGADQRAMLEAQLVVLDAIDRSLSARHDGADATDRVLLGFRLETTRAAARFVQSVLEERAALSAGE